MSDPEEDTGLKRPSESSETDKRPAMSRSLGERSTPMLKRTASGISFTASDMETSPAGRQRTPSSSLFTQTNKQHAAISQVRQILSDTSEAETEIGEDDIMKGLSLHALFCQMDILCHFDDGVMGWKEYARWLKYEEKVESGDRWSKPHVPTTSLHALFLIRKAIAENECTVILDMEATHGCMHQVAECEILEHVVELVVAALNKEKNLSERQCESIMDVLLRPHKHKHRKGKKKQDIKKSQKNEANNNDNVSPPVFQDESVANATITSDKSLLSKDGKKPSRIKKMLMKREDSKEPSALTYTYPGRARPDELKAHKPNKKLMKKIPGGSEAVNILVGQVDFLQEPLAVFIRLHKPHVLSDLTEVSVPTRFLFLVLGPPDKDTAWEYEEVGRAAAALFIDRVFCEVAYKASTTQDLVDGIDEFIDDLCVLPPSIWDPSIRLEPPEKEMSMEKIKKRLMDSSRHNPESEAFHMDQSAGEDSTLARTGRPFGGMWKDIKRRFPLYWSDIRDGFHPQCLASILFLYFACITPIVTFGGLLGGATDNYIGTMETMLAGALCGIIYHTFAGQPLTIVGSTGPLLIFESILYLVCKENDINFLAFRFYTGLWITILLLIFVAFDLSSLVKFITRFTEESFAVLISLIFIFEAFKKLAGIWHTHPIHIHALHEDVSFKCHCEHPGINATTVKTPVEVYVEGVNGTAGNSTTDYIFETIPVPNLANWSSMVQENCITYQNRIIVDTECINEKNCTDHHWLLEGPACNVDTVTHSVPDVFFLCCFLFIGTFVIAYFFRTFKSMSFFPSIVRSTVSDFAVLLAIIICTVIDIVMDLDTPKLQVPTKLETTRPDRGWIVNPIGIRWFWALVALLPGLLATILIFLDQQITAVIVNRKEHKLKKSHGYHLDLFVLAILVFLCSLFALPWFVAATVRSITHVRSLIRESELRAPGERPQFLGVREQRFTGICIHILIGLSVFLTAILKHVPMAVLYGVFLYMGVTSLGGVQFVDRILILFMPEKYQPDHIYLRHVQTKRVHIFTIVQLFCMVLMWVVKSIKMIAIVFPVLILALCFVRKFMDFVFTRSELFWLDHLLPEATRKAKEDKAKMDEKGIAMDELNVEENEKEDLYLEGNWDKMIAKRDYGVGRKARNRKLSRMVIDRYNKKESDDESETDEKLLGSYGQSFRDRKFSL